MKLSELTKEQKQMLVLAVGGVITMIAVLSNVVIGPARENAAEAQTVIQELEDQVRKGESQLKRDRLVRRNVKAASKEILDIHREHLPPRTSPYIWAVEQLSLLAEDLNLVISVQEHPTLRYVPVPDGLENLNFDSIPYWIPYTVEVEMGTSFANLKNFLALLEEDLLYASVSEIRIQASDSNPEEHDIRLLVEWPTFRFGEDLAWIQGQQPDNEP